MPESLQKRNSIVTRLTLMVAAILGAAVLVVGGLALLEQRRQLSQAMQTKAISLAQFMAQVSPLKILSLNFVEMNSEVSKVILTDQEAVCALIVNPQGIPLAYSFKDSDPLVTEEVRKLTQKKQPVQAIELMKRNGRFLVVTAPVAAGEKNIGAVTLGFSYRKMHRALLAQSLLIGSVLVGVILLSSTLLRLVLRQTLLPVKRLTEAATQIRKGKLEVVVAGTERTDELGFLSRAFESMAKQLRELIAGLKQREHDLRELSLLQRTILDNAAYGIISATPEGVVTSLNPAAERLLGYSAAEILGKQLPPSWYPGSEIPESPEGTIAPGVEVFAAHSKSELPMEKEWTFLRKDGARVPVLLSMTALRDDAGCITGFVGMTYDLTARKKDEAELRESAEEIHDLYHHAPCGYHSLDKDGVFVRINDTELGWLGYSRQEVQGKMRFLDLMAPECKERCYREFEAFKMRGWAHGLSFDLIRKDGTLLSIILNATAARDLQGNFLMSRAVVTDITELKRAQQALAQEKERLQFIFDSLSIGICLHRIHPGWSPTQTAEDGQFLNEGWSSTRIINDAHLRIAGICREEDRLETWRRITHPDDRDLQLALTREVEEGKRSHFSMDKRYLRPDGQVVWVIFSFQRRLLEDGGCEDLTSVVDITERKRAEEALRESEASLRALTESMPQLVWICRPDGWNIYFNQRWVEYTGLSLEESYGHGWNKPFHPEDQQRAWEAWQSAVQTGGRYDLECRLRQADGSYHWFLIRGVPLRNDAGEIIKWFGTCTNIDEQKQAQEEVRKLNAELDHRVQQRTAMLEAANKELEAFSYSVSHDLRAPLRSIDGFSKALLEDYSDKVDEEGKEYLAIVRAASQRMGQLIDDILQLSRISRSELRRSLVDLSAIAGTVAATLEMDEPERKVNFVIEPNCTAFADGNLARIVLENLLGNAWKFTSKTPGARIEFGMLNDQADEPVFYVRDNGAGFDQQYSQRLFGAFQRLHTTSEFPGTGVGLASVKRIIQRHGGKVWIEGKVGEGATAYFTLPKTGEAEPE